MLGRLSGIVASTVYQELYPLQAEDVLDEVKREARKSVAVHDHNPRDATPVDSVQKGAQAGSFEVDA